MAGLKFEDDFEKNWDDIQKFVGELQNKVSDEKLIKRMLREIGKYIKEVVHKYAPARSANPSYSDAGMDNYKHIVDDITFSVKRSKSEDNHYVSIKGGKWTGYKWLWVNDGHVAQDGTFVPGCHFVDKAEKASTDGVNEIVEKYVKEALRNDGQNN